MVHFELNVTGICNHTSTGVSLFIAGLNCIVRPTATAALSSAS
jgi:hypothetical protein